MADNTLTYSIAREWLQGRIGNEKFALRAWSGGGRGKIGSGAEHDASSYDVFRKTSQKKGVRGGPLPPGIYICRYVAKHSHFGECVFLEQTILSLISIDSDANIDFYDREGFYIHGRGKLGSDGCIVPESEQERRRLNTAVKDAAAGSVMLQVAERGMPLPASRDTSTRTA